MKGFYIITNRSKHTAEKEAEFIKKYLEDRGRICYLQNEAAYDCAGRVRYTDAACIPDDVECIIAIGGDGTLLHASRDLVDTSLPLMGINLGTLGYLAEIERSNIAPALERLIADDFFTEDRMMLQGTVITSSGDRVEDIALNDIVISRRGRLRVVDFNVYVNDVFLCSYRADGIIVSTPTGSTGYSLSAGGPIVSPDASLILLTPLAPHTLISRTIVLPDDVVVSVEVGNDRSEAEGGAEASFDGDTILVPATGGRIEISKSAKTTHFIKMNHTSFVENLREKLGP